MLASQTITQLDTPVAPYALGASASTRASVLFVDDDVRVLRGVERSLGAQFAITTATSAMEALALIEREPPFAVVVSDLAMPAMSGLALLSALRKAAPESVRILFTGEAQLTDAVRAINEGEVFRLLLKPCTGRDMLDAVRAGVRQHQIVSAERTLLRETLQGAVEALSDVLAIAQPAAYGRAVRLRRHVVDLAKAMELPPSWELAVSALLSQMGCVTLAPALVDRWYRHEPLSDEEQRLINGIPTRTAELIAHIPRMTPVCEIIQRQFESPRTLGIPVGAKLLAIARDFDGLIGSGERAEAALAIMKSQVQRYDESMLAVFHSLRCESAPSLEIREMRLCDVRVEMVFAADVLSPRGVLLIARGQRVTTSLYERIVQVWSTDAASAIPVRVIIPE
ncbi:MAG: response regulator [Gemmatimonadetes bacterium]|nr:response regulator [Gemmatimonadota bacterium]